MVNNNVISQLSQKNNGVYDAYKIGPDLQYVGAYDNSNNHNLEEQLFIGYDKEVNIQIDPVQNQPNREQITKITKFKKYDAEANYYRNYYILTEVIIKEKDCIFDTNKLIINKCPTIYSKTEELKYCRHDAHGVEIEDSEIVSNKTRADISYAPIPAGSTYFSTYREEIASPPAP